MNPFNQDARSETGHHLVYFNEWNDPSIKSKLKRSRLADFCVGQENHQRKILEALTPIPCQESSVRNHQHNTADSNKPVDNAMMESNQVPFSILITTQTSDQKLHDMRSDSGRYSSIAAMLSSLDSCEGLNDGWGATHETKANGDCDRVLGDDDGTIALLLKYTHVGGGWL